MKIAFNPSNSSKNILDLIKTNKDIIFDLKGHSIYARGVEFKGTDTNTWRDIKINNVSIGSHTLDLRNGSNTTLSHKDGIVTINSTWRPVVDNLSSDSTTSSLSAKQGKVLVGLINSKSDSGHTHDDRYLRLTGGTMFLGEGLKFHSDNNYFGTNADARIISLLDDNDKVCEGGLIIDERGTLDGKEYVTELLRIRDSEFKWKGSNILHSGNSHINGSTITLNGTSITVYNSGTADGRYVKKSGDTMSGALNLANNTWNKVGDDSYMGDCNVSGHFGIKAANTTYPGIAFFNNANAHLGSLTAYSGNIKYGAYSLQFLDNGNTSVNASTWTNPFSAYNSNAVKDGQAICVWGQSSCLSNLANDTGDISLWLKRVNAKIATLNMVLDGEYYANGNQRLAHVSEIPSSLRNPYALTISLNGTSQGPYDGSATKNINITPGSIGAATSGHNHDDRYLKLTGGTMTGIINRRSGGSTISGRDHAIIRQTYAPGGSSWNPIACVDTETGTWTLGHLSSGSSNTDFNFCFSTNTDYNAGNNEGNYVALRNKGGIIALTSEIPSKNSWNYDDRYYTKAESNAKYITDITTSVNKLTFTKNGSNITRDITVNNVQSLGRRSPLTERNAISGIYTYGTYSASNNLAPSNFFETLGFGEGTSGTIEIGGNWTGGNLYWRALRDCCNDWFSWKTILDSSNYSSILDSRYYTESEVNSLLDAKLNRQNLSYGTWNPRGYNLAADYFYNGGDLSISESKGQIHVSINGYFWQNEGQYRVLDTSDVAGLKGDLTVHQYLSATNATWWPLIWGGSSHNNTKDSTGAVYKSHDKLSWQTSSQTLYATNIRTENIKHLSIGGGIYWNPNVESATDGSDVASITLVKSGVAGGTTLVLSQMNDTNDTIQFKTNTAAKLYHNSYPILTTQNTYVNNHKGYINGTEITQVNNADTLDGAHLIRYGNGTGIKQVYYFNILGNNKSYIKLGILPTVSTTGAGTSKVMFTVKGGINFGGTNESVYEVAASTRGSIQVTSTLVRGNRELKFGYVSTSSNVEIWMAYDGIFRGVTEVEVSSSVHFTLAMTETTTKPSGFVEGSYRILASTADNVASATKLQTPRSIWGQSFDGTRDVDNTLRIRHTTNNYCEGIRIQTGDGAWSTIILGATGDSGTNTNAWSIHRKSDNNFAISRNSSDGANGLVMTSVGMGLGTTAPTQRLDVNGNIKTTGNSYATHFYESSDKTLKKNIKSILSSTNIPKIREFDWKDTGKHSYGFIAQELEEQGYDCLVSEVNGKKTVNYTATLALTVAKLQNLINIQNKKISNLTKELKALKYGRKKNS